MTDQDINNTYRFIASLSCTVEHYRYCKDALIEFDIAAFEKTHSHHLFNRHERKLFEKKLAEHRKEVESKHKQFESRMEKMMDLFENGSKQDREMIDIMIDALTEKLKDIEIVTGKEQVA